MGAQSSRCTLCRMHLYLSSEHFSTHLYFLSTWAKKKISLARFSGKPAACSHATSTASVARLIAAAATPDMPITAIPPTTAKAKSIAESVLLIRISLLLVVGLAVHRPPG